MKIRFVKDHHVQQGDGNGPKYKVGEVVEFNGMVGESYGRKYIARGYAEEVKAEPPRPAAPAPAASPAPAPRAERRQGTATTATTTVR